MNPFLAPSKTKQILEDDSGLLQTQPGRSPDCSYWARLVFYLAGWHGGYHYGVCSHRPGTCVLSRLCQEVGAEAVYTQVQQTTVYI